MGKGRVRTNTELCWNKKHILAEVGVGAKGRCLGCYKEWLEAHPKPDNRPRKIVAGLGSGKYRPDPNYCRSGKHLIAEVGEQADGRCKKCATEWHHNYRIQNKEKLNARQRERFHQTYIPHPKPEREKCSQGHTYAVTGRYSDGHCAECSREKDRARQKERYREQQALKKSNPKLAARYERWERTSRLQRMYGLSAAEYDALEKNQKGLCAACGKPETTIRRGKLQRLSVDHNHTTGARRGLACNVCNRVLGMVNDDPERLRKLADYLESFLQSDTSLETSSNDQLDLL